MKTLSQIREDVAKHYYVQHKGKVIGHISRYSNGSYTAYHNMSGHHPSPFKTADAAEAAVRSCEFPHTKAKAFRKK